MRHLPYTILAAFFLVPSFVALWLVRTYGVNVFWLDGWHMTDLIVGPFHTRELFAQYNEHLYVLPRLAAMATGWNSISQMYLTVVSLGLAAMFVTLSIKLSGWHILWAAPIPALLLGFRHQENMLWGNQTSFAFALSLSVGALYTSGTRLWYLGIPLALGASLSAAQGVFAWPAGLIALLFGKRWIPATVWFIFGVGFWVWYLGRYQGATSTSYALSHPVETLTYFAAVSGGAFAWEVVVWVGTGILALTPLALWFASKTPSLLGIIVYALLCLSSIAAGRVQLGVFEGCCPATASRYAIFSALLLAGVYGAFAASSHRKLPSIFASLLVVGMLYGIIVSYQEGLLAAQDSYESRSLYAEAVRRGVDSPALSEPYTNNPTPTRIIEQAGVNAFSHQRP